MPVDFDIDVFLDQNRGNKPPYLCPVEECGKIFKKWASLEHHMDVHRQEVEDDDDANTDCFSLEGMEDSADGASGTGKPSHGRKPQPGGETKLDGNRRRRRSMSPPSSGRIMKNHDSLSFADSQKFVTFDTGGRRQRFNIYHHLRIVWADGPVKVVPVPESVNGESKGEGNEKVKMEVDVDSNSNSTQASAETPASAAQNKSKKTPSLKKSKTSSSKKPSRLERRLVASSRSSVQSMPHTSPKLPEVDFEIVNDSLIPKTPPPSTSPIQRHRGSKRSSSNAEELVQGYIVYIEPTTEELDEQVEYDIDEEDEMWLDAKNAERLEHGLPAVTEETFEFILDRFEKEAEFTSSSNPICCGYPPQRNKTNSLDDDAVCAICLDGTCENTNAILFCDMCNLAVHQECYGVPYIPEGQWLCRRCLHSPSKPVECVLCPNKGGAFKKTVDDRWGHVTCALWIPEVIFANPVFLEPIDNLDNIPNARWRLNCYICRQRGRGACIQCHKNSCYAAFHVTCAQQAGLYMKIEGVRDRGEHGTTLNVKKTAFCDQHSPPDHAGAMYAHSDEEGGPPSAERAAQLQKLRIRQARKVLAERRNSTPAVSVPIVQKQRLQNIYEALADLDNGRLTFLEDLYAFWTLKRQARNGVPLLRRLQAASNQQPRGMHGLMMVCDEEAKQLRAQMKFWQRLRQDLEKARLLSELIRKREKLKKEVFRVQAMTLELKLQPFVFFLKKLIAKLQEFDKECIFAEPVSDVDVPGYSKEIKKPMDLSTMRKKANNHDYNSLKALENDVKLMVSNCMHFNASDTIFYKAAVRLGDKAATLFKEAHEMLKKLDLDTETGLHRCDLDRFANLKAQRATLKILLPEDLSDNLTVDSLCALSPEQQVKRLCDVFNAHSSGNQSDLRRLALCLDAVRHQHQMAESVLPEGVRTQVHRLLNENVKEEAPDSDLSDSRAMQPPASSSSSSSQPRRRSSRASRPPPSPLPPLVLDTSVATPVSRKRPPDLPSPSPTLKRRRLSSRSTDEPPVLSAESIGRRTSPRRQSVATDSSSSPLPTPTGRALRQRRKESDQPPMVSPAPDVLPDFGMGLRRSRRLRPSEETGADDGPPPPTLEPCEVALMSPSLEASLRKHPAAFSSYRSNTGQDDDLDDRKGSGGEEEEEDDEVESRGGEGSSFASSLDSVLKKSSATATAAAAATPSCSGTHSTAGSAGTLCCANGMTDDEDDDLGDADSETDERGTVSSAGDMHLEPLDLVWAKCRGYPWYPGLIIDPDMPRDGYTHNGVPIPVPPDSVLDSGRNARHRRPFLVLFFDQKRTWQWLSRDKLEPLGVDSELDLYLMHQTRRSVQKKSVRKAYENAVEHLCKVNGRPYPFTDGSDSSSFHQT